MQFTLRPGIWYATEFIGDEFGKEIRSYSPIRVDRFTPKRSGQRRSTIEFYHANYPEGVGHKSYELATIERASSFLLARSVDHEPTRFLLIYDITWPWIEPQFPNARTEQSADIQGWLSRNC